MANYEALRTLLQGALNGKSTKFVGSIRPNELKSEILESFNRVKEANNNPIVTDKVLNDQISKLFDHYAEKGSTKINFPEKQTLLKMLGIKQKHDIPEMQNVLNSFKQEGWGQLKRFSNQTELNLFQKKYPDLAKIFDSKLTDFHPSEINLDYLRKRYDIIPNGKEWMMQQAAHDIKHSDELYNLINKKRSNINQEIDKKLKQYFIENPKSGYTQDELALQDFLDQFYKKLSPYSKGTFNPNESVLPGMLPANSSWHSVTIPKEILSKKGMEIPNDFKDEILKLFSEKYNTTIPKEQVDSMLEHLTGVLKHGGKLSYLNYTK